MARERVGWFQWKEGLMESFVASSKATSAAEAGKEVAQKVAAGIKAPKVAMTYGSCEYDSKELLAAIAKELPGVPVIGNTSFTGIVTPEGYIGGDTPFVGILALGGDDVTIGTAGSPVGEDGARATGHRLAEQAMAAAGKTEVPDYWFLVCSPGEEEYYMKGVTEVIGRIPMFGGSAADNAIAGDWWVYAGTDAFQNGAAVVFFYTDTPFTEMYTGAYDETGDYGVVTKMRGDRDIMEIDGKPALKVYADWRGMDVNDLKGAALLSESVVSPIGVKDRMGDLTAIRHPMAGNDDLSISVGAKVVEKTCVVRVEGDVDHLIEAVTKTADALKERAGGHKPAAYFFVHCGGRRAAIGDRIGEVADRFIKAADGVPFIVEFTFDEYGYEDDGLNTNGGLSLSFVALG
jgi:hypothetical protein